MSTIETERKTWWDFSGSGLLSAFNCADQIGNFVGTQHDQLKSVRRRLSEFSNNEVFINFATEEAKKLSAETIEIALGNPPPQQVSFLDGLPTLMKGQRISPERREVLEEAIVQAVVVMSAEFLQSELKLLSSKSISMLLKATLRYIRAARARAAHPKLVENEPKTIAR